MTPSLLKQYLQERKKASLRDLALHFDASHEAIQNAMALWIRKDKVEVSESSGCDKGCCQCSTELTTIYHWKETTSTKE